MENIGRASIFHEIMDISGFGSGDYVEIHKLMEQNASFMDF